MAGVGCVSPLFDRSSFEEAGLSIVWRRRYCRSGGYRHAIVANDIDGRRLKRDIEADIVLPVMMLLRSWIADAIR